jgi:hypothetical protein
MRKENDPHILVIRISVFAVCTCSGTNWKAMRSDLQAAGKAALCIVSVPTLPTPRFYNTQST